ncbi:MAG TPA: sulfurtransferase [Acidimicrobiales bacterium]|jgi:thiosulfate/3-mercaptopyruvate sulfurtransferase
MTPGEVGAVLAGPLVDAGWLFDHLGDVSVVDVRWYLRGASGREAYERGHIPGAHFVDLDRDLAAPPSAEQGRHPLPSPETFAHALGRLGIAEGQPVVAYDDVGGSVAARLWWLLRTVDQPVAVLDGGLASWSHPLSVEVPRPEPVVRTRRPWRPSDSVDADTVAAIGRNITVLDARSVERYRDGDPSIDPRPGHIPGAGSAPWQDNLDPASGRFLPPDQLRARYLDLGVRPEGPTIVYCGSGVTACHDLLALDVAGFASTCLYPGSWSQWAADAGRPAETGGPVATT